MKYLEAFPDFDSVLPRIHGFVDSSWHLDGCPCLTFPDSEGESPVIWCNYADKSKRPYGDAFVSSGETFILSNPLTNESRYSDNLAEILLYHYADKLESTEFDRMVRFEWFSGLYRAVFDFDAKPNSVPVDSKVLHLSAIADIQAIAYEFRNGMFRFLGAQTFDSMCQASAERALSANDFCDANQFMLDAFQKVKGREMICAFEGDSELARLAWKWAQLI